MKFFNNLKSILIILAKENATILKLSLSSIPSNLDIFKWKASDNKYNFSLLFIKSLETNIIFKVYKLLTLIYIII